MRLQKKPLRKRMFYIASPVQHVLLARVGNNNIILRSRVKRTYDP